MHRLFLLAFITYVSASTCPEATPVYNFNFTSYGQGIWYEFARYAYPLLNDNTHCISIEYTLNGDATRVKYSYIVNNKEFFINCTITFKPDALKAGKMIYEAVEEVGDTRTIIDSGEDTILAIDYDNYIIIRSCQYNEATKKYEGYGWVLSRSKYPSKEIRTEIENFIKNSTVLDSNKFLYIRYDDDVCRIDP